MSSDHPLLKSFTLPLAHQLLQQEETLHCLAHGFLLIPLVTVSDHILHPRQSPNLSAQAHPGVMEYSVPSFSFCLPKLFLRLSSPDNTLTFLCNCAVRRQTNTLLLAQSFASSLSTIHIFSMLCHMCLVWISELHHQQQWRLWGQDH